MDKPHTPLCVDVWIGDYRDTNTSKIVMGKLTVTGGAQHKTVALAA